MRAVNIATLKNRLSGYLREVREGEELLIRDRRVPIARIVPLVSAGDIGDDEIALAAEGLLRLPAGPLPRSFWSMPAPRVPARHVAAALRAVREDR
jgi:prevent-host-death family protein